MSNISFLVVALSAIALSAPAAFAVENVTWEQFVAQCENPKGSGDKQKQFEPEDIKIECEVRNKEFVEESPGAYDLPAATTVTASIISKKQAVAAITSVAAAQGRTGECVRYKERERVTRFTQLLTCADIVGIAHKGGKDKGTKGEKGKDGKGDDPVQAVSSPTDWCNEKGKDKGGKDRIVEVYDTGVAVNSCPANARYNDGKDKGKEGGKDEKKFL